MVYDIVVELVIDFVVYDDYWLFFGFGCVVGEFFGKLDCLCGWYIGDWFLLGWGVLLGLVVVVGWLFVG